ncbi:4-(cytidine 5'-diphospho)-2-C-methyl-D-erythritol kinase [Rhizosaccharibacter radicis]|uniref:4-diphosphocytidyl-2-C-methyl-D-erythritol kinase n=1 Tax=Rhizosaccharibacter radicis TaxID=2782605 RepID=A0ABT1W045_9PROT|nr:4-(cytidine 5'-diphospho)-2-C-methyl-D-erythritol kinase [Acetobacteraceae bacterium KSS12]
MSPSVPWSEPAHAKINLFLHVTGRRADGYHLLDSLAVFAGAHDLVEAAAPDDGPPPGASRAASPAGPHLVLDGPFAAPLRADADAGRDNLVLRAARWLAERSGRPNDATLRLEKHLPVASGIGGGSADAAAVLRLLRRRWGLSDGLSIEALAAASVVLGADVPVCVRQRPARMGGIGEQLEPAPEMPGCFMLLANPGVAVSTPAVFRAREEGFTPAAVLPARWPDADALAADLRATRNDLQPPAIALCPPIDTVLAAIAAQPGCLLSRMSGSGATCFGLFASAHDAATAAAAIGREGWWVWSGPMLRDADRS